MNPPIMPAANAVSTNPPPLKKFGMLSPASSAPLTKLTASICLGPGRLAHKWIDDFLLGGLGDEQPSFNVGCLSLGHTHDLVVKPEQCVDTGLRQAGEHYLIIVSTMCKRCLHHFILRISAPTGKLCGRFNNNAAKPLHHMVPAHINAMDLEPCRLDGGRDVKFLCCCGHAAYMCSVLECSFRVAIEVSLPRLPAEHAKSLTDDDAVKRRLRIGIETNPERFQKATDENLAPKHLHHYLSDALMPPDQRRSQRINVRNIKFAVQFGTEESGNSLFEFLGFEKETDTESEFWRLPNLQDDDPPPRNPAVVPSRQSFFQDVLYELNNLRRGNSTSDPEVSANTLEKLRYALHCSNNQLDGFLELDPKAFRVSAKDREDYEILGLTERTLWKYFAYAYECQTRADPDHSSRVVYLESLKRISSSHNEESLNMFIATEESTLESEKWEQIAGTGALGGLNEAPQGSNDESLGSMDSRMVSAILGEYRNKVQNSTMSPSKEVAARKRLDLRSELRQISVHHSEGPKLMEVVKEPMELDEALVCLELPLDQEQLKSMDPTLPQALAQGQVEQGKNEFLTGMALKTIGTFLNNDVLANLASMMMGEMPQLESPSEPANDPSLPAGLDNLRNTCYLNSMLQYFFTINPVRDLVLNFDEYKLPDTEESRSQRRVTTEERGISAKQAYVAHQLTNELRTLFNELKSTTSNYATPTQRLALAAMKNTDQLEARYWELEKQSKQAVGPQRPGPLGADSITVIGPEQPPSGQPSTSTTMNSAANHAATLSRISGGATTEHVETASDVSSQTLVNHNDCDDQKSPDWNPLLHRVNSSRSSASGASSMRCQVNDDDLVDQKVDLGMGHIQELASDGDVHMTDSPATVQVVSPEAGIDPAVDGAGTGDTEEQAIARIMKALDDKTIKGTDQEDVQEAMDKMLFNLQSAIKPTGVEPVGPNGQAQTDAITEVLRLIRVGYHKAINKAEWTLHSGTSEYFLLAYPTRSGTVGLHEALERGFMREISENPQDPNNPFLSFSSIRKFPPILHICIQRTVYDQSARAGKKIDVSIQLPQVLYMDRYKESSPGNALWQRRQKYWDFLELENPKTVAAREKQEQKTPIAGATDTVMTDGVADADELEDYHQQSVATGAMGAAGVVYPTPPPAEEETAAPPEDTGGMQDGEIGVNVPGVADPEAEAEALRAKYDDSFDDLREHEYLIHAVICHGGSTGASGHYWVWIYDFEKQVWFNYNDRTVRVHADGEKVLKDLSASDQPYYIAYVRRDSLNLVSIPRRDEQMEQLQQQMQQHENAPSVVPLDMAAIFG
ncbi:hypothetical protein RB597_001043 [Gaeumannomyces tritici]